MNRKVTANKSRIAQYIFEHDKTSKQEIAYALNLSMPTVLQCMKDLTEEGIVSETGAFESTGGRKAKMLSIVPSICYAVGIDITRNHLSFVLLDAAGQLVTKKRIRCNYVDEAAYYETLGEELNCFIEECGKDSEEIKGVGISIPGILDETTGILIRSHIFSVKNISLRKFSQWIAYPVCFSNDANSAAHAELDTEVSNMVYLSLSDTVGGAACMDHRLYLGENFKSGEFGHMILVPHGKSCYCGKKGCLDAYCSAKVLAAYRQDDLDAFFEAVQNQEEDCVKALTQYLYDLSVAITNLRMAFDCTIILGGYVGAYLNRCRKELDQFLSENNNFDLDNSYVTYAKYQTEAPAIGVAMEFIKQFYQKL